MPSEGSRFLKRANGLSTGYRLSRFDTARTRSRSLAQIFGRFFILTGLMVSAVAVSSCTASRSTVTESLESAAMQPEAFTDMATDVPTMTDELTDVSNEETTASGALSVAPGEPPDGGSGNGTAMPVPTSAPVTSELALAGERIDTVTDGAKDATASVVTTEPTSSVGTETTGPSPQSSNAEPIASASASTTIPVPTSSEAASETADNAPAPSATTTSSANIQQSIDPTERPPTFFELLFGKPSGTRTPPTRLASKEGNSGYKAQRSTGYQNTRPSNGAVPRTARAQSEAMNSLPGVQNSAAIFGIEEEDGDEEENNSPNIQMASVGAYGRFMVRNGLVLQTEKVQVECFKPELMRILKVVEQRYRKPVIVTSGYRSPNRNKRAGGVRNSTHIYCKAADIQIEGVSKWDLAKFLRTVAGRGGVGTYCRTESVHIDVGTQRDWHHPCRRSKSRIKKKT